MASTRGNFKTIHLFNCDKLYDLNKVESLLKAVEKDIAFKISKIEKHPFYGRQISEMAEKTIPNLRKMDYAVFVVHAHESSLSFNFDSSYGKIYRALKTKAGSDANVLIVIGGDDKYKDDDEKERDFLSSWARTEKGISRQFRAELIDGRKSFIFSWNKQHRPIHEEALRHYFDPSKKGQKFKYESEQKPPQVTENLGDCHSSVAVVVQQEEPADPEQEPSNEQEPSIEEESVDSGLFDDHFGGDSSPASASDTVVLSTYLRYGEISFKSRDVQTWDGSWQPSQRVVDGLKQKWGSTRIMYLTIFTDGDGKVKKVDVQPTIWGCAIS